MSHQRKYINAIQDMLKIYVSYVLCEKTVSSSNPNWLTFPQSHSRIWCVSLLWFKDPECFSSGGYEVQQFVHIFNIYSTRKGTRHHTHVNHIVMWILWLFFSLVVYATNPLRHSEPRWTNCYIYIYIIAAIQICYIDMLKYTSVMLLTTRNCLSCERSSSLDGSGRTPPTFRPPHFTIHTKCAPENTHTHIYT